LQDRETKDLIRNDYVQVATGREPALVKAGYVTIFNDYIITTQLPKDLIRKIEDCYQKTSSVTELEHSIRKLGIEKRRVQLIIERNKEKAKVIRKKLSPDFHIPKELREKFDLFDFWCPNCLEILSECYFDFNVDLESCDFDWTITDLVSF
jgi:hypothetical protein